MVMDFEAKTLWEAVAAYLRYRGIRLEKLGKKYVKMTEIRIGQVHSVTVATCSVETWGY
jgi:hypothetical protein